MHNSFKNTLNSMRTQVLSASYTQSVNLLIKTNKMDTCTNSLSIFSKIQPKGSTWKSIKHLCIERRYGIKYAS